MKIKSVTAQLVTIMDYLQNIYDIKNSLSKVKEMGYSAVQVSGMCKIDAMELKGIVDELGLKICITHIPAYEDFINDIEGIIKEHKILDCPYVAIGSMPPQYRTCAEGYRAFASEFSKIGKVLAENGLGFSYHNHKFEFERFGKTTGMDILFCESDPRYFNFELDTYWVQAGGANPVDWIRKLKGRMQVIHLKDMAIKNNEQIYAEVGEGNLNWQAIFKACEETGVEWYAVEQDYCQRNPFDSLKMSFDYIKTFCHN